MPTSQYDAIIIGAGIIGNCIAFELAKKGFKTLSIDKLGGSGCGSTSGSCAIVRAHYSTFDGVAIAYEGFRIWSNWAAYLELARFRNTGSLLLKTKGHDWRKVRAHFDAVGVKYDDLGIKEVKKLLQVATE
jgi:sarcosine oxidase subunit beta